MRNAPACLECGDHGSGDIVVFVCFVRVFVLMSLAHNTSDSLWFGGVLAKVCVRFIGTCVCIRTLTIGREDHACKVRVCLAKQLFHSIYIVCIAQSNTKACRRVLRKKNTYRDIIVAEHIRCGVVRHHFSHAKLLVFIIQYKQFATLQLRGM